MRGIAFPAILVGLLGLGGWSCPVTPPKPTPSPTVAPTPTPEPTPTPTPPPVASACPKPLAAGSEVYLNNKRYGNGLDSTVRVKGDPAFCQMIHGVTVNDCHLEGWPKRSACEMELIGGCPIWQYSMNGADVRSACRQAPHPDASCDHWGDPVDRDDPQTPEFEGRPFACGIQRDPLGDPTAGFFVIGHGEAWFRACKPDGSGCGPWTPGKDKL
jgi:hypothetical protein